MRKFDLQDALLLAGVASIVGGVAAFSQAGAAIVFGIFCLMGVRAIGRARKPEGKL